MHPERRVTLDSIRFRDVLPHPLSRRVYGTPKPSAEMILSIERVGILQPLIVNETAEGKFELLVGNTRREAWKILHDRGKVKSQWIPCKFVKLSPLEAERIVLESNRQRKKTKEQDAREYKESVRIEKELAAQQGKSVKQAREKAATGLSTMGRVVAERLVWVIERADVGDEAALKALEKINSGTGVTAAYKEIRKKRNPEEVAQQAKRAQEFSARFKLQGVRAEVTRAASGKFHVMLKDQTEEQVEELLK